jgi:ribosomal protein S18 acetylase RimI-like enzyme
LGLQLIAKAGSRVVTKNAKIRTVTATDLQAVRDVLRETWHATYDELFGPTEVDAISARWHALDVLKSQMAASDSAFLVAEYDEVIVGTSLARQIKPGEVLLDRIYVLPIAQGIGIGLALLNESLVRFPGTTTVRLEVEPRNFGAIRFYEAQGFVRVGAVRQCGGDAEHAADVYELRLS